jgi:predicted ATPase
MINEISFKNFKLFKNKQTLQLRPITILIGKNNTGKTAVAKLPTLIAGSLSGTFSAPINLENEGVRLGLSYEDIFYNRVITGDAVEFEIKNDTEELVVFISGDRKDNIIISKYKLNGKEFDIRKNKFSGFTINSEIDLKSLHLNFDYIDSFRKFPDPQFHDISREYTKIGMTGENAYKLLAQYHKNDNLILNDIKKWFKENFEGWEIEVRELKGSISSYEIVLSTSVLKQINIVNTGSGIRQSLPLIVRSFMPVEEKTLIIIEEPETHLHPAAHGNLAQRFAESYVEDNKRRYLIETHSQNFVLRMRGMVAEGKLNKDDLAIYYVDFDEDEHESTMRLIEVDENGNLPNDDWPEGVFNETSSEIKNILKAQFNKKKHEE